MYCNRSSSTNDYLITVTPKFFPEVKRTHGRFRFLGNGNIAIPASAYSPKADFIEPRRELLLLAMDRDRGAPRGAAPPSPPGIRVTYHGGSTGLSVGRDMEPGETEGLECMVAQGHLDCRVS